MREQLDSIRAQWQGNSNLRFGVWAIAAIILFTLLFDFRDLVRQERDNLTAARKKLAQVQAIAGNTRWVEQRELFETAKTEVSERFLHAQTVGLAQADVHAFLDELLEEEGLSASVSVEAPEPAPPLPNGYAVAVELYGSMEPGELLKLLYALETAQYFVAIDNLELQANKRRGFSLECRFFALLDEQ